MRSPEEKRLPLEIKDPLAGQQDWLKYSETCPRQEQLFDASSKTSDRGDIDRLLTT